LSNKAVPVLIVLNPEKLAESRFRQIVDVVWRKYRRIALEDFIPGFYDSLIEIAGLGCSEFSL